MSRAFIILAWVCFALPAFASVRGFGDWTVAIKPYAETPIYGLDFKARQLDGSGVTGRQVLWEPNLRVLSGVDVSIGDWIGFGVSGKGPMSEDDRVKKGKTEYDDYRFNFAFNTIFLLFTYQSYTGFYATNSQEIDASTGGANPFLQDPDLKVTNMIGSFNYVFSPKDFSLKAVYDQTVRQETSGGSWLAGATVSSMSIESSDFLIPSQIRSSFGDDQNISKGQFSGVTISGGGGYTFVFSRKWFLSLTLMLGAGPQSGKFTDSTGERKVTQSVSSVEGYTSLGYNGDDFFAGLSAQGVTNTYRTKSIEIDSRVYSTRVYIGFRF